MNQLNNPLWPFPIHNGERTLASKSLLQSHDYVISFERKEVSDEELQRCKVLKYKMVGLLNSVTTRNLCYEKL